MYKNATLIEEFLMKKAYKLLKNSGKLLACMCRNIQKKPFFAFPVYSYYAKSLKEKNFFWLKK